MRWTRGDNYAYLLTDSSTSDSWLIDPAEPSEVLAALSSHPFPFTIKTIVNTHHHHDHSGGNAELVEKLNVPVIAGKDSPLVSHTPSDHEIMRLGEDVEIEALHTPCHTIDSICYYARDTKTGEKAVFTGDTLFNAGCGRFFEGSPQKMDYALNEVLAKLPKDTKVFPGHEYTKSNVKFAVTVLSENRALRDLEQFMQKNEISTGKFTIGDELAFNPFMRLEDETVQDVVGSSERGEIMKRLRELKNKF